MAKTTGTARRNPYIKPASRRMVRAQVLAAERISPTFVRITVGGEDVDSIAPMGFDHWFRMFLPAPGRQPSRGQALRASVPSPVASPNICGTAILAAFSRKASPAGAGWLGLAG